MQLVIFLSTFNTSCIRLKIRYDSYYAKFFGSFWVSKQALITPAQNVFPLCLSSFSPSDGDEALDALPVHLTLLCAQPVVPEAQCSDG
jgi:hypothetical protein